MEGCGKSMETDNTEEAVECFLCSSPATPRYSLILDTGKLIEDKPMCDACYEDVSTEEWIEITAGPILMRGGSDTTSPDDEDGTDE